jgi:heterodisulfide reductase subunit C
MATKVETRNGFLREVISVPGGEDVLKCIQCGTCSGSCPNAAVMDHTPRKLIQMVKAGMRNEVLSSNSMWMCLSCYTCTVRCPRDIKITDLMHSLECLAVRHRMTSGRTHTPAMYRSFSDYVYTLGNVPEFGFMAWFYMLTNPLRATRMTPLLWKLIKHRRIAVKARRLTLQGERQLRAILDKAETLGGAE